MRAVLRGRRKMPRVLIAQARRAHIMALMLSSFCDHDAPLEGMCIRPIAESNIRADFFSFAALQSPTAKPWSASGNSPSPSMCPDRIKIDNLCR
ncbi:hypothetical protein PSEUDO9AZ_70004 [Pseudomonas sp. 9AZ]|nr:hypothetical protein PSEUDO9AZ_70004 [Pseudomonas sp. 9AZ]